MLITVLLERQEGGYGNLEWIHRLSDFHRKLEKTMMVKRVLFQHNTYSKSCSHLLVGTPEDQIYDCLESCWKSTVPLSIVNFTINPLIYCLGET